MSDVPCYNEPNFQLLYFGYDLLFTANIVQIDFNESMLPLIKITIAEGPTIFCRSLKCRLEPNVWLCKSLSSQVNES